MTSVVTRRSFSKTVIGGAAWLAATWRNVDQRHIFNLSGITQSPFGKGKKFLQNGPGNIVLGGWQLGIDFWSTGGAIDLSHSKDPRWNELERRFVLSQYLTRIQSVGSLPPQETGLTCNSWFGKFHLEMHWWHAAHFALWGRHDLLERSLSFYKRILPKAQAQAKAQGYEGARWPKCVGPAGDPGPTYIECFLIWQQPHPISYAELCYRANPGIAMLTKYRDIVFESASFIASFAVWDKVREQYRIGPPFADASEVYFKDHEHQWNPTFEVAYWHWGLETAQHFAAYMA